MKYAITNAKAIGKQYRPPTLPARAVYEAKLPLAQDDFEYYVSAETAGGNQLIWPATAPQLNQTVVTSQP